MGDEMKDAVRREFNAGRLLGRNLLLVASYLALMVLIAGAYS